MQKVGTASVHSIQKRGKTQPFGYCRIPKEEAQELEPRYHTHWKVWCSLLILVFSNKGYVSSARKSETLEERLASPRTPLLPLCSMCFCTKAICRNGCVLQESERMNDNVLSPGSRAWHSFAHFWRVTTKRRSVPSLMQTDFSHGLHFVQGSLEAFLQEPLGTGGGLSLATPSCNLVSQCHRFPLAPHQLLAQLITEESTYLPGGQGGMHSAKVAPPCHAS